MFRQLIIRQISGVEVDQQISYLSFGGKGPEWLQNKDEWPQNIVTTPSPESESETKTVREVLAVAVEPGDELDQVMEKYELWKAVRITTWVVRFINNCRAKRLSRKKGPISTEETEERVNFWIRRTQARY
jgi:hypothetical protein